MRFTGILAWTPFFAGQGVVVAEGAPAHGGDAGSAVAAACPVGRATRPDHLVAAGCLGQVHGTVGPGHQRIHIVVLGGHSDPTLTDVGTS